MIRLSLISAICILFLLPVCAQQKNYSVANAHSHNDYQHDTAFYAAYNSGFGSIEADIFAIAGELYVAHSKKDIQTSRTLAKLYLDPLSQELKKDRERCIQLLIDVKENTDSAMLILLTQLKPLEKYISSGRLVVLISGARPAPQDYKKYPSFISFDDDLIHAHTTDQWNRVGLVSLQFSLFTTWKGTDLLPQKDEDRLRRVINAVHAAGKKIRFWDAPDNDISWREQMKLNVDFIGTDHIQELGGFLSSSH